MTTYPRLDPVIAEALKSLDFVKVTQITLIHKMKISFEEGHLDCHPQITTKLSEIATTTADTKVALMCGEALEEAGLCKSGDKYIIDHLYDATKSILEKGNLFLAGKMLSHVNGILSRKHELADVSQLDKFQALQEILPERVEDPTVINKSILSSVFRAQVKANPHDAFMDELKALQNTFDIIQINKFDATMKTQDDDKGLFNIISKPIEKIIPKDVKRFIRDFRRK